MSAGTRLEALDRAVRLALGNGAPMPDPEKIVESAEKFNTFLMGDEPAQTGAAKAPGPVQALKP